MKIHIFSHLFKTSSDCLRIIEIFILNTYLKLQQVRA